MALRDILDTSIRGPADAEAKLGRVGQRNITWARQKFQPLDIKKLFVAIDVGASPSRPNAMRNCMPCLTASRGASGGPWISCLRRKLTIIELMKAQGFDPQELEWQEHLTEAQLGMALGNAMSQCTLQALLAAILACVDA